ncbi:MAG: methyltransferase domain-containing protein [Anaerolineae bacterium]|nr:methyltransferase domain-containing protein [Anaerolineae bacterium]
MIWLLVIFIVLLIGLILYWQLILAEGAYLGAPLVALLYDWTAERYNGIKEFSDFEEDFTLGRPLANRLYVQPDATVLDVATGTGRLAMTLFRQPSYRGKIIGLDRASKMLAVARRDLEPQYRDRIIFIQADAMALPFADNSLPVVSSLEALEFYPDPKHGIAEMVRVLKPISAENPDGGWLLTTNRIGWEAKLMPGKTWSRSQLEAILEQLPLRYVDIQIWETIYDLVWAQKINAGEEG